ncbi:DNA modification methylase [Capnocytophaga haemolytica]|uniref:DNA methylase n=1 Tax=Capnocytophaga haemolytica TaxID=45243 RepID=A0AAX2GVM8_9FLAO|nr:DNA methyltransferase [Capnocytophaga haemolytica]AMD85101.1 DNA methylase [Capnocytophaga haemolytica]SFN68196.1 DNA modification methylase [Capnocytophaga haemolytica]SNV05025.1 putative methyltransferase [Capnocytophaga haemolytica]
MDYNDFLKTKQRKVIKAGFKVTGEELNSNLFDFQKYIVTKALEAGRYAIFADCGLGKTISQLEWAHQVVKHTEKPVLILCPLAVSGQTIQEGEKFGIEVRRLKAESSTPQTATDIEAGIYITNYEQLEKIDVTPFAGVVLDESSILKNFTGKYKRLIIEKFKQTPYKLCCTATPSPNDLNEIGNHSEFLNVLDAQDMRAKWFVRDEGMNNYRLKGHAKSDFYGWVSSWATMLTKPSDIGFSAEGYDLPALNYIEQQIQTQLKENGKLFNDTSVSATEFNKELRVTLLPRMEAVAEIVNSSTESFIIWVNQNEEEKEALRLIPDAVAVNGSEPSEKKEEKLLGFAAGAFRVLVTKKKIAQFGMNFQNCHNQIFAGLDFSFEGLYQAIRRSYRFGQTKQVNIYLITTDTMENVKASINKKERQFKEMQTEMNKFINGNAFGLLDSYEFKEVKNEYYHLMKGDSCIEIKRIPDNSVDLIIFSPPFSSLFTYSNYIHDMGNNESHEEFFKQYSYLLKDLYRILKAGRLMVCHTKDLAVYKNSSGYTGMYDFTGEHHRAVELAGFKYHSKINIWTDPVLEMQRAKPQRLLYKQIRKDSSYSGVGMPEYCTVFRKWEGNEEDWTPINNKNKENFPLDVWQQWASPIWNVEKEDIEYLNEIMKEYRVNTWFDIKRTDVLNNREGTAMGDEKHIAPLQLSVIRKCVQMWSNVGETVFTPFLGIGSEVYEAVKLGRKGIGIELKDSYFETAVKNVNKVIDGKRQLTLF